MTRIVRDGFPVKTLAGMAVAGLLLVACNGDNPGNPGPVNVAQCSGAACGPSGGPTSPPSNVQLCPTSLDYSTTYTGGTGSGEYIKVKFNSTASPKTYQMTFVESEVPTSAGQVNNTRAGLTINGTYTTPDVYTPTGSTGTPLALPSAEQNRCAIVLLNGTTADGTYSITINPADPPLLFVGMGIMGGSSPGATISYPGINLGLSKLGVVPPRTFDSFPFIAFSQTVTDFTKVAGTYNELGFRVTPEGSVVQTAPSTTPGGAPQNAQLGWQPDAIQASETFKADGTCVPDTSQYSCSSTGAPWTLRTNADGSADTVFRSGIPPGAATQVYPVIGGGVTPANVLGTNNAHGIMIVGNVGGTITPVIIRVGEGFVSPTLIGSVLDDQIGISLLAPATKLAASDLSGGYVGANSVSACGVVTYGGQSSTAEPGINGVSYFPSEGACIDGSASTNAGVNSTAALFQSPTGGLLNPFSATTSSNFTMDFTQTQPGLVKVTATTPLMSGNTAIYKAGDTGAIIKVGQVYALLMNGVNQQFTTQSPSNVSAVNPFLTVGAFVQ
ncbi:MULTISPECIES: DUF2957 domain-containing protein [Paraburkholderia]|uniref:DUF2957 domain-containing protein n=1 Tax=Paraburkholderia TaxID=1822464 RepID=UPI002258EAA8|nr:MULTISPECIES: DUF2957 domain-containing protein [Paraburkholderia]MCX4163099.1 DUF2957 domain-containing protein [Paraburkholderia megapolitana]MDN7158595.1 DUF2957 domain-containing protein [Paraburkholderia sp. CHISQ3]MDQ6495642.1 DUF2957 domain-containing protein [Paraburkholderia megapolitana]